MKIPGTVHVIDIGPLVQVEALVALPEDSELGVLALGEDRHRVLNPCFSPGPLAESMGQLIEEASEMHWSIGDVVLREGGSRPQFDVVVYDLDAEPMVTAEAVCLGIANLVRELQQRGEPRVAMELVGMAHRGITIWEFTASLRAACRRCNSRLRVQLCNQDAELLREVMYTLRVGGAA